MTRRPSSYVGIGEERYANLWFIVLSILAFFASILISGLDLAVLRHGDLSFTAVTALGIVMFTAGVGVYFSARLYLGRFFSTKVRVLPEHQLITKGPYRFVRHPIYLGGTLYALSIPLILGSLYGFAVMMAIIPLVLHRIDIEERVLSAKFGQAYEEYSRRTKKLIPFVY